MNSNTIEILKLVISLLTPLAVIIIGYFINNNLEKTKTGILKEKEWQVRWAELFLTQAIEFNRNLSLIISSGFLYYNNTDLNKLDKDELMKQMKSSLTTLTHIQYDIANFSQFAIQNHEKVISSQMAILLELNEIMNNRANNMDKIRQLQFDYNQVVRKAHTEILNTV